MHYRYSIIILIPPQIQKTFRASLSEQRSVGFCLSFYFWPKHHSKYCFKSNKMTKGGL